MGVIAKGILRGCQGLFTPVSSGYPLSVFNENSTLKEQNLKATNRTAIVLSHKRLLPISTTHTSLSWIETLLDRTQSNGEHSKGDQSDTTISRQQSQTLFYKATNRNPKATNRNLKATNCKAIRRL